MSLMVQLASASGELSEASLARKEILNKSAHSFAWISSNCQINLEFFVGTMVPGFAWRPVQVGNEDFEKTWRRYQPVLYGWKCLSNANSQGPVWRHCGQGACFIASASLVQLSTS